MKQPFVLIVGLIVLVGLVAIALIGRQNPAGIGGQLVGGRGSEAVEDPQPQLVPDGFVEIGGVVRPRSDVEPQKPEVEDQSFQKPVLDIGHTPLIKKDETVYSRSVAEALGDKSGKLAHRLTPFVAAPKFDEQQFLEDPEAYANEVVPGRIFDILPASPDTPSIRRVGSARFEVIQGESVILRAQSEALRPVTFYSGKFGRFNDGLSTITVIADEDGVAEVRFMTTPGMMGDVDIVATSPVRSGRARYVVEVRLPADRVRGNIGENRVGRPVSAGQGG